MNSTQLVKWLQQNEPPSLWFVCGDEPLQATEAIDAIRVHARKHGYDERVVLDAFERGFQWQELAAQCMSMSLFSSKRLIEVRLGSRDPGREGSAVIRQLLQNVPDGLLLLLSFDKNDSRTKQSAWYKAIAAGGEIVTTTRVNAVDLPRWLVTRAGASGVKLDTAAAELIANRTEGHLLAAAQEVRLLVMLGLETANVDDVVAMVTDNARFNVFDLLQTAWAGDSNRTFRMLRGLRDEGTEPVALLGALLWDLRRVCAVVAASESYIPDRQSLVRSGIYGERQRAVIALLRRLGDLAGLYRLLAAALQTEKVLKSGDKERSWRSLTWLFMDVCWSASPGFRE